MTGSTRSWVVKGQRVNKSRNRDSQWGPGRVHWTIYVPKSDPENRNGSGYWIYTCRMNDWTEHALGGTVGSIGNVPRDEPVTCKNCLRIRSA